MPRAESQNTRESQQTNSYLCSRNARVSMCNNPVVNEETLFTIIQSIKNLESLLNNVKSSILTAVESKLQEMKSTLVSAIDNAKMYSEAVLKQPVIDSSSADEGYFNNTTDTTTDGNSSQTLLKTVYPSTTSTVISETVKPTLKRIPVHVTNRNGNMVERNDNMLQDNHRQQNVNRSPVTSSAIPSTTRTLLIGDLILSLINLKGIVKGVQKH